MGEIFRAGLVRRNVALLLARSDRIGDGIHYARAALSNLQTVGPGAAQEAALVRSLIDELESGLAT